MGVALGKYEVTVGQYSRFVAATGRPMRNDCYFAGREWQDGASWRSPGFGQSEDRSPEFDQSEDEPVVCVSWEDALAYTAWLSERTGKVYRLPKEDEWEAACRAGRETEFCGSDSVDSVAWHHENSGGRTHPVGQKQPNAWGLYDMSGNVWEWTQSCWEGFCGKRVVRGGSWHSDTSLVRVTYRNSNATGDVGNLIGFRVARVQH
ncbi:formylglycine-generating enzyme family protein [Methylolobus aquaticus]